ncbi:hypothetical protein GGR57DRAFT_139101 [Xylariaceae sp. FL1272]|nr:hypothetical protein GGR57DRAFT_139101 [Xylariaceae sp. FL1272]
MRRRSARATMIIHVHGRVHLSLTLLATTTGNGNFANGAAMRVTHAVYLTTMGTAAPRSLKQCRRASFTFRVAIMASQAQLAFVTDDANYGILNGVLPHEHRLCAFPSDWSCSALGFDYPDIVNTLCPTESYSGWRHMCLPTTEFVHSRPLRCGGIVNPDQINYAAILH